jgi:hypothetical protein
LRDSPFWGKVIPPRSNLSKVLIVLIGKKLMNNLNF